MMKIEKGRAQPTPPLYLLLPILLLPLATPATGDQSYESVDTRKECYQHRDSESYSSAGNEQKFHASFQLRAVWYSNLSPFIDQKTAFPFA